MTKDLISSQTVLFVHDKAGHVQTMPMTQKKDIIARVAENVNLGDSGVSTILSGENDVQALANSTASRLISETLGKKEKKFYVLDESKVTEENLAKLGQSVKDVVTQAPLINEVVQSIEQEKVDLRSMMLEELNF